jgi:hypothetical protein
MTTWRFCERVALTRNLGVPCDSVGLVFLGAVLLHPASTIFLSPPPAVTRRPPPPPTVTHPLRPRPCPPATRDRGAAPSPRCTAAPPFPLLPPRPLYPPATNPLNHNLDRAPLSQPAVIHRPHSPGSAPPSPPRTRINSPLAARIRTRTRNEVEGNKTVGRVGTGHTLRAQRDPSPYIVSVCETAAGAAQRGSSG